MQELEKILEEIESERTDADDYWDARGKMFARNWNSCIDFIGSIIRKHMNDGWIPIGKERPEEGQEVWVSTKTDCVRRGTYTKHFGAEHSEGFICSDGFIGISAANAWQPYVVPDPYISEDTLE